MFSVRVELLLFVIVPCFRWFLSDIASFSKEEFFYVYSCLIRTLCPLFMQCLHAVILLVTYSFVCCVLTCTFIFFSNLCVVTNTCLSCFKLDDDLFSTAASSDGQAA